MKRMFWCPHGLSYGLDGALRLPATNSLADSLSCTRMLRCCPVIIFIAFLNFVGGVLTNNPRSERRFLPGETAPTCHLACYTSATVVIPSACLGNVWVVWSKVINNQVVPYLSWSLLLIELFAKKRCLMSREKALAAFPVQEWSMERMSTTQTQCHEVWQSIYQDIMYCDCIFNFTVHFVLIENVWEETCGLDLNQLAEWILWLLYSSMTAMHYVRCTCDCLLCSLYSRPDSTVLYRLSLPHPPVVNFDLHEPFDNWMAKAGLGYVINGDNYAIGVYVAKGKRHGKSIICYFKRYTVMFAGLPWHGIEGPTRTKTIPAFYCGKTNTWQCLSLPTSVIPPHVSTLSCICI